MARQKSGTRGAALPIGQRASGAGGRGGWGGPAPRANTQFGVEKGMPWPCGGQAPPLCGPTKGRAKGKCRGQNPS